MRSTGLQNGLWARSGCMAACAAQGIPQCPALRQTRTRRTQGWFSRRRRRRGEQRYHSGGQQFWAVAWSVLWHLLSQIVSGLMQ